MVLTLSLALHLVLTPLPSSLTRLQSSPCKHLLTKLFNLMSHVSWPSAGILPVLLCETEALHGRSGSRPRRGAGAEAPPLLPLTPRTRAWHQEETRARTTRRRLHLLARLMIEMLMLVLSACPQHEAEAVCLLLLLVVLVLGPALALAVGHQAAQLADLLPHQRCEGAVGTKQQLLLHLLLELLLLLLGSLLKLLLLDDGMLKALLNLSLRPESLSLLLGLQEREERLVRARPPLSSPTTGAKPSSPGTCSSLHSQGRELIILL